MKFIVYLLTVFIFYSDGLPHKNFTKYPGAYGAYFCPYKHMVGILIPHKKIVFIPDTNVQKIVIVNDTRHR